MERSVIKLTVYAKPSSKHPKCVRIDEKTWTMYVREPAVDGRANEAIREALADELKVAKSCVTLVSGATLRIKRFIVETSL